jgi:hypothetical protein
MDRTCNKHGEITNAYYILVGKHERKRPPGGPRDIWEDNIKIDLKEIECGHVDMVLPSQDRIQQQALENTIMKLPVLYTETNFSTT